MNINYPGNEPNNPWEQPQNQQKLLSTLDSPLPIKLSWINEKEDYQVFHDTEGNFILIGIWKKYPIKCKEYKPGISWRVYYNENNIWRIWFSINGYIKHQVFLNKDYKIININNERFYSNPILAENSEEKKDEKQQIETPVTLNSPLPIELSWININKNYKVFHDKGEKFILIDIWEKYQYPIKCKEYKPGISWLVYKIENGTYKIWFSIDGSIKEQIFLNENNRIIDIDNKKFYNNPTLFEEENIYIDPDYEDFEDPDAPPRWNPYD